MRILLSLIFSALILTGQGIEVIAQEKKKNVDVSGTWRYEFELEGETRKDTLKLDCDKNGNVTGTYQGVSEKPIELKSGKVVGDEVSLVLELNYQGIPVTVNYKGKVKADDIVGEVLATTSEGEMPFDWVAKRSVQAEDLVGVWELEIDAGERVLEPKLELTLDGKALKGKYLDSEGDVNVPVDNPTIEKNNLKFNIVVKMDVGEIKASFSGRAYGNKISGTIDYSLGGEQGQAEFTGVRKPVKK